MVFSGPAGQSNTVANEESKVRRGSHNSESRAVYDRLVGGPPTISYVVRITTRHTSTPWSLSSWVCSVPTQLSGPSHSSHIQSTGGHCCQIKKPSGFSSSAFKFLLGIKRRAKRFSGCPALYCRVSKSSYELALSEVSAAEQDPASQSWEFKVPKHLI